MTKYYSKGLCPKCQQVTLTTWPLLPDQTVPRRTCENLQCRYKDAGA